MCYCGEEFLQWTEQTTYHISIYIPFRLQNVDFLNATAPNQCQMGDK